jgi:hypothetical protein
MADTGCIYGESNTFKSTAGKHFSHYIYEVSGKKTLLVSMDGGGWVPMRPEIEAGVIVPYRCNTQVPLPVIRRISQGYFPENPEETEISRTNLRLVDWSQFGGMIVEGLSSISQVIMRHLADKAIKTGEEATNRFEQKVLVDGKVETENFAGNSRGHYGFVQNQIYSMVTNFASLPCRYVLFTALESRTEDDDRSTIYGPQIAGKKATALVPSWIGDCIHAQSYPVEKTVTVPDPTTGKPTESKVVDVIVRNHFTKHPDPVTGIMFPAKPRVTPEKIAELWKIYPGGYFQPTPEEGFDKYLHTVDKLSSSQAQSVAEWRKKVDERFGRGVEKKEAASAK